MRGIVHHQIRMGIHNAEISDRQERGMREACEGQNSSVHALYLLRCMRLQEHFKHSKCLGEGDFRQIDLRKWTTRKQADKMIGTKVFTYTISHDFFLQEA